MQQMINLKYQYQIDSISKRIRQLANIPRKLILLPGQRWPEEMIDGRDCKGGMIERHVDRHDEAEVEVE